MGVVLMTCTSQIVAIPRWDIVRRLTTKDRVAVSLTLPFDEKLVDVMQDVLLVCVSSNSRIGHANRLVLSSQGVDDPMTLLGIYMATRRIRKSKSLAVKSMELAMTVPPVVAHRVTRMALAGPKLSDRDRKEFQMMVNEKRAAFAQAWGDMAIQAFRANQALTASMLRSFFTPFTYKKPSAASVAVQVQNAAIGVLGKGLAPVHRKAVSNARRLAKTKLR
jgi:hypothetical protein